MKSIKNILLACAVIILAYGCKPNLEGFVPMAGNADFTSYVAIGNSLTSGYADGALSRSGQMNSFPMMLSNKFEIVGGGDFNVPFLSAGAGNNGSGATQLVLSYLANCAGTIGVTPVRAGGTAAALTSVAANGPFNLLGVPGARAVDATSTLYSSLNPFLSRMVQTPSFSSMLSEALRAQPTFFTLWLGSNDVLGYATAGGIGSIDPAFPLPGDISSAAQVGATLTAVVDSLTSRGAKGVIANIPEITSIPFFTTIPYNGVDLTQGAADTLNGLYAQLGITNVTWKAGVNPFVIEDTTVVNGQFRIRHAAAGELILLSTPGDSLRCAQWGVDPSKALGDQYVLDAIEVAEINAHIAQYNSAISNIASSYNIGFADMNTYMKTFNSGIIYNGIELDGRFISGGAFSLDGVHPNPRGYALIANEFIKAINSKYESRLSDVDVTSFDGVTFP